MSNPSGNVFGRDSRRETLCALRDLLAANIDESFLVTDLAMLSLRLEKVLEQIDQIDRDSAETKPTERSPLDELARRRTDRRTAAPSNP